MFQEILIFTVLTVGPGRRHLFRFCPMYSKKQSNATLFIVIFNNVMWEIPGFLWLIYLVTVNLLNIARLHKLIQFLLIVIRQFG